MPQPRSPQPVKRGPYRPDIQKAILADRKKEREEREAEEARTGTKTPPDPLGFDQQKIEPSGDVREYEGHDRTPDTDEAAGNPIVAEPEGTEEDGKKDKDKE